MTNRENAGAPGLGSGGMMPRSIAKRVKSARRRAPVLSRMRSGGKWTVRTLMVSCSVMSWSVSPPATSCRGSEPTTSPGCSAVQRRRGPPGRSVGRAGPGLIPVVDRSITRQVFHTACRPAPTQRHPRRWGSPAQEYLPHPTTVIEPGKDALRCAIVVTAEARWRGRSVGGLTGRALPGTPLEAPRSFTSGPGRQAVW
jgi:hypothetical protein